MRSVFLELLFFIAFPLYVLSKTRDLSTILWLILGFFQWNKTRLIPLKDNRNLVYVCVCVSYKNKQNKS